MFLLVPQFQICKGLWHHNAFSNIIIFCFKLHFVELTSLTVKYRSLMTRWAKQYIFIFISLLFIFSLLFFSSLNKNIGVKNKKNKLLHYNFAIVCSLYISYFGVIIMVIVYIIIKSTSLG